MKDLYTENYKTLMKETKEETNEKVFLIFTEIGKNNPKIHMEPQKTLNTQNNFEKKEQRWRHPTSCFQTILQSNRNQIKSMVLA